MKILAILFLLSSSAWSYPVFFKCEAGGRLTDQITPAELSGRLNELVGSLRSLTPQRREEQINEYCEGGALCMREFEQLLRMAEVNNTITREIMDAEFARVREAAASAARNSNGIAPVSDGIFSSALREQQMRESFYTVRECRIAMENFSPENLNNDGQCVLANFGHSPYMYPSGLRFSGTGTDEVQGPVSCSALTSMVQGALSVDEDPFAAIAISLMENGTQISGLYLDPIGSVQTLGCPSSRGTRSSHNMNSYGTYYNVQYGVRENPALVGRLRSYLQLRGVPAGTEESYLCNSSNSSDGPSSDEDAETGMMAYTQFIARTEAAGCTEGSSSFSCTRPLSGHCCVRVPFGTSSALDIDTALTYSSFNRYISSPLEPNLRGTDSADFPARRLQRFNGYSDAMGGAEAVSAWRSGVNYYQTPAYGYQAMDFILNTLWNNPFVRNAVREAERQLGRKSKSVLCQDRGPGVYTIEHDHYFEKHANSPRMTAIQARWNQNPNWSALPARYQRVLQNEFNASCRNTATFCGNLNSTNYQAAAVEYFRNILPNRRTVAMANQQDQGFTWAQMTSEQFSGFLGRYGTITEESEPSEPPEKISSGGKKD